MEASMRSLSVYSLMQRNVAHSSLLYAEDLQTSINGVVFVRRGSLVLSQGPAGEQFFHDSETGLLTRLN